MIYDGWLKIQDWFHERSLIYDKYSKSIPKKPDVINVDFLNLRYGWLEMVFRINGQKQLMTFKRFIRSATGYSTMAGGNHRFG